MDCRVKPGNDGAAVGYGASAFALRASAETPNPPYDHYAYAPSTVMTMSFSSVDSLRNAISG
jgi:hypothetical protein